ncbi:hypothetical protein AVEN_168532-1 [Araneus ventricosus]|uniref:Uncharacterized protein n=1 Tax=Araneus ventricosus TaxID=182803 RepID=A0A4Y2BUR6_ARAVE|nr:hypothetical protein AVEN_3621-1 [Araneus ventricosus]GBL95956.1 hypothetical protein AVEN_195531-1 [Araneus ventricosus]GBL95978.1 hypothetical protein AVEN_273619-1 [Araneus ventricosus]GBL96047.1 hypothetical protein AVEN_168532-1 [Araneus ventricosus]
MIGNNLPCLTSLVSNCIGWMDMYWYGDNLMNPWNQYVNRELFNLGQVCKQPVLSPTPIYVHCAFRRIWTIPAGQCDTPHVKSRYQVALGPIWVVLQCAVQKRSPPPGTLMDLRTALQDSWCGKPSGYFQTLVDTLPRHVAALRCARVGPKRY